MNPLLFTDPAFLFLFAPVVLSTYWLVPVHWRNLYLLCASLSLYAWGEGRYAAVLMASIAINWAAGTAIARTGKPRPLLVAGIALNLALLGWFKYAAFVLANLGLTRYAPQEVHLPAGISFYTFMGIAYLVDVYRRDLPASSGLGEVALYQSLFPHLVAGPIVRMTALGPQFTSRPFDLDSIAAGARRFIIGLAKKTLIAGSLASSVNTVFALRPSEISTSYAWLALLCFTLQIYYDFSGYSDMAIGLARMLGFRFPENFNYPYTAQSIADFWRRWHITLSSWLRDYLFFPLGGAASMRNILIVFLICGLWHGAAWHFVLWGLWHGLFLALEQTQFAKRVLESVAAPIRIAYTLFVVVAGWVMFRSESLHYAVGFFNCLAGRGGTLSGESFFARDFNTVCLAAILAGVVFATARRDKTSRDRKGAPLPSWTEPVLLALLLLASLASVAAGTYNPFIYFRF